MDRIRIVGGRRLDGTIPISGAKNATLPLMIASLLTEETLDPRQRAAARRCRRCCSASSAITASTSWSAASASGETADHGQTLHISAARIVDTTAPYELVSQNAGELLGARAACRPHGRGAGLDARRLRHRHAAGRSSDHGDGAARRRDRDRRRLCGGARAARAAEAAKSRFPRSRSAAPTPRSWRLRSPTAPR